MVAAIQESPIIDDNYRESLLEPETDDFSWLGLTKTDLSSVDTHKELESIFLDKDMYKTFEGLIEFMSRPENFGFTCKHLLNLEMAPYQEVILKNLWSHPRSIFLATRGGGKSFLIAVFGILKMIFEPGCKIAFVGAGFRQSRQIWDYMSTIYNNAPILRDIIKSTGREKQGPRQQIDRFEFLIGDSISYFMPLGAGEKIRGYRANIIVCDEFASIDYNVFNEVIKAFANVSQNPIDSIKQQARIKRLEKQGIKVEEEIQSNQIVLSGTPKHEFNHFYQEYIKYKKIIKDGFDKENKHLNPKDYCIVRLPYNFLPDGFLDQKNIEDSKQSMPVDMFNREYGACFTADSSGFYKRSVIDAATCNSPIRVGPDREIKFFPMTEGESGKNYIMGVDTAKDKDNAAIVILEKEDIIKKIVYCWSFNADKFNRLKKLDKSISDEYYQFLARKIKYLMSKFPMSHIIMDKYGGGEGVCQALADEDLDIDGVPRVFPIIDSKKDRYTDTEDGLHIVELVAPTSQLNEAANHGMLSDLQQKRLIFPAYDPVEMERQIAMLESDRDLLVDTYEDVSMEIEELKEELETVQVTPTARFGSDHFDVPRITVNVAGETKKQRLRKDRYSALLYANYSAAKQEQVVYKPSFYECNGTSNKKTFNKVSTKQLSKGQPYYGRGWDRLQQKKR